MIGEISALGSALAIAGSAVLSKSLLGKFTAMPLQTMRSWAGGLFLLAACLILGRLPDLHTSWLLLSLMALSTFVGVVVGDTLYLRTLGLADVSRAFPIVRGTQILSASVIAASFLGEHITWSLGVGAVLVLGGVYLAAFPGAGKMVDAGKQHRRAIWMPLAVLVGLCWALSWCIMKIVLEDVDPLVANTIRIPVASLMLTTMVLWMGEGKGFKIRQSHPAILGLVVATGVLSYSVGVLLALYAIYFAGVSQTAVLTATSPIFVLALSVIFLHERLTLRLSLGTLLCAVGIAVAVSL